ncbi:MAG: pantoate--beta-alanine ligase [Actinomycetaceae bacterium]|nr:pantoate--beta-alanine ligase [Actinomycetaceae bacterium]MDO5747015.1 pantoate--beta-alanine ligase [Actinomycetaceae bacterium]
MIDTSDTRLIRTREDLRYVLSGCEGSTGLVMTKGNVHEGHVALVTEARHKCDTVVVSIFVDPLDDTVNRPREAADSSNIFSQTLDRDFSALAAAGADIVFAPSTDTMYPSGLPHITINPGYLAGEYEGKAKPGYFSALCQLSVKMLNLVEPDSVFMGQKDAQELAVIRQLVRDFDYPITVVSVPTVRDGQGVPVSNQLMMLSEKGREQAAMLSRSLRLGIQEAAKSGSAQAVLKVTEEAAVQATGVDVDYVVLVDALSFEDLETEGPKTACLVVAGVLSDTDREGKQQSIRLTDNVLVVLDNK